jgi:CHAT domain-containing protein
VRAAIDSQGEASYLRSPDADAEPYRTKVDPGRLAVARRWHAVAERVQPMAPSEEGDAVLRYVDALLSVSSGQPGRAVTQARAALRFFDARGDHEQSRSLMVLLAEAENQRGSPAEAVRWCDEALLRTAGPARSVATLRIGRGGYLLRLGRARPAIDDLTEAIRLSRADDDGLARVNEGSALSVLSRAWEYLGDLRGALEAVRDSLRLARALGHKDGEATELLALGTLIGKHVTGWLGTTLSTADADTLRSAVFQADPSLAAAWPADGLPAVAVALLERAERLFTEIHDEDGAVTAALNLCNLLPPDQDGRRVEILTGLVDRKDAAGDRLGTAVVLANLGAAHAALGQTAQAVDAYERSLAISRPAGFFESAAQATRDLAELRLAGGDAAAAEIGFTESVALIEAARADLPLTDHHRVGFVRNKGDAYLSLVDLLTAREAYDEAFELVQRAKSRALLEITAGAAALDPITVPRLRAWLAAQGRPVLLAEYFLTGDQITLFFLRPEWEHVAVHRQEFTAADLRSGYEDFRRQVVEYRSAGSAGWTRLGAVLTEPIAAHAQPGDLIYLVPHRLLHGLPIHALPLGPDPLIVRHPVAYAPASGLLPLSQDAAKGTGRLDSCASFGVVFEEEAREVAALFGAEMAEQPRADRVEELCAGKDVCHFSCHGYFNAEYPLSSGLLLGPDDVLPAREVMEMRLRAELISLSACDSGASQVGEGDELLGLLRAFLHAGASSLVAGLWTVDAESTRELMAAFYGRLRDDYLNHRPVDKAEALRQAQLRLMAEHGVRSAYHWAPFVLVGDWRLKE